MSGRDVDSRRQQMYRLSDDERVAVRVGKDAADRGEFVPDEEIEVLYERCRNYSSLRGA